jgi:sulfite reductase subunit B
MTKNIYQPIEAKVFDIIEETHNIKTFCIEPKEPMGFKTGQFVELTIPGIGEAPFTPSSDPNIKDKMEITIMNVGRVTSILHSMSPSFTLGIRGPYGNGYPLDKFKHKEILIVGGGVGLAPLRSFILALFSEIQDYKKIVIRYGSRSPKDIVYKAQIPQWAKHKNVDLVTTVDVGDNTYKGNVGLVTTILKDLTLDIGSAISVVCGPPIMMKFVTFKLSDLGFSPERIYLSMEKNMSCGLGKCGHCRIGKYYVCKDGPVFTYEQLKDIPDIWD